MPRKRKAGKRRESSGNRWKRNRAAVARYRALGVDSKEDSEDANHQRIEIDSMEFACLFVTDGKQDSIGDAIVRVFDANGRPRPLTKKAIVACGSFEHRVLKMKIGAVVVSDTAVAPKILEIGRDKAAILMQNAGAAERVRALREERREKRKVLQMERLLTAHERKNLAWFRQEVPDQPKRSILVGSNNGKDPTSESDSLVVCYKEDDGRYHISEETWDGSWSAPSPDGFRSRENVKLSPIEVEGLDTEVTFHSEHEAHKAVMLAVKAGELERFAGEKDADYMRRTAEKLLKWEHNGKDRKQIYG